MRKLIAAASATVLIAGTMAVPTMASGGSGGNDCSHGQAGDKNPHCNGGKPGGHPYKGNGCPSFLLALNMCKRPNQ